MPSSVPLKLDTSKGEGNSTPAEICLSPSWSDHGEKKRKKEKKRMEKEQKEVEKKLRQEQERQRAADIKAGKRLSKKPPPVSMETQKMPQALRRNSWTSIMSSRPSSGENTRRSSREEKRLSGVSVGSMDSQSRSRSTPATSTEETSDPARSSGQWHQIVSSDAPKLPNFGWSSRRTSSGTNKSLSWGEDVYTKEVISFAYRLEGLSGDTEHNESNETRARKRPTTPTRQETFTPAFSRSITEPSLTNLTQKSLPRSPQRSPAKKEDGIEPRSQHGHQDTPKEQRNSFQSQKASPNFQTDLAGEMEAIMASHGQRPNSGPPSPRSAQTRSSHDGSSYVHKQRMYQQQRSIAGFEDEQAVKDANDMAAKSETVMGGDGQQTGLGSTGLDTPKQNNPPVSVTSDVANDRVPISPRPKDFVTQPDVEPSTVKQQTPVTHAAEVAPSSSLKPPPTKSAVRSHESTPARAPSRSVRDSFSLNKTQATPGSKADKILSFRRRSKLVPSKISVPENVQNNMVVLQSVPPAGSLNEEPSEKRSKVERISQEIKNTQVHTSGRKASESSARSQPRESLPEPKLVLSHARNRTSSSEVLSDNLPSPVSPKAKTEPVSIASNKATQKVGDNEHSKEHLGNGPGSPRSKQITSAATEKALPETPPATKDASGTEATAGKAMPNITSEVPASKVTPNDTSEATTSKATTNVKLLPEVIVESTTEEGLVRKTSIKRPRSNPQLQTQTTVTNSLDSLDFLPQLKHQPLVKRQPVFLPIAKDRFPPVPTNYAAIKSMANRASLPSNAPDLNLIPRSPLRTPSQFPVPTRTFNRSVTEVGTVSFGKGKLGDGMEAKPMAKLFVICCKCKFWHDLPSKLYEAMALPKELDKDESVAGGKSKGKVTGARLETAVKCPWCEHAMTTWCCQGWTTVVYLHERHH